MACILKECLNCKEYSKCPLMSAVLQRNYANRTLDDIHNTLERIEKLLDKMNGKV